MLKRRILIPCLALTLSTAGGLWLLARKKGGPRNSGPPSAKDIYVTPRTQEVYGH